MKYLKKIFNKLYKINVQNIFLTLLICLLLLGGYETLKYILTQILNIHLGLFFSCNFLNIYSGVLTLVLPVAILIIERIAAKDNVIISETYLKYTKIFPSMVYFVFNLIMFIFIKDQYYFIITLFISAIIIIYMYYYSFRMISDLIFEKKSINSIKREFVQKDLEDQIVHFSDDNLISSYKKYGIMVYKDNYISTINYEKLILYPDKDYLIIKQYNYKCFNKIIKILKEINKEYISSINSEKSDKNIRNEKKLNIIISLLDIGSNTDKNNCWITIYYKKKYKKEVDLIVKQLNNKAYFTSEINNHLYIETVYQQIQKDCIKSINNQSATLLTKNLNKYLDIYKIYINEIVEKIGTYTYENSYNQVNALYSIRAYDFLKNIKTNIYDYSEIIVKNNNYRLMNSLISFLYSMIRYSYDKRELLSIQHLFNVYSYLCEKSLELKDDYSFKKIRTEIFEFMNILKYDYNNIEKEFIHDTLLICNKTLGNIIYHLSLTNIQECYMYYDKTILFLNDLKEELDQDGNNIENIIHTPLETKEQFTNLFNIKYDIYKNFTSNIFAITSYIIQNYELSKKDISKLMNYFSKYDSSELTEFLVNTIYLDYNSNVYSWDLMEANGLEEEGTYSINTKSYLIHLYCLLITKFDVNMIKIRSDYNISIYADEIICELKRLEKKEFICIFENIKLDIQKEEKDFIRNNPIDISKIENFKEKFKDRYYNFNKLIFLFKEVNKLKVIKKKRRGKNYLGIHNIVDKLYFLNNTPNNKCIVWHNFEDGYANSFINSEEKKISFSLNKKAKYCDEKMKSFLNKMSKSKLKESILFSNYKTIYNIIDNKDLKYNNDQKNKYSNIFIVIKDVLIPIMVIEGIQDNFIFHAFKNEIGTIEKEANGFKIKIQDFYDNKELLNKTMKKKINGLDLIGEEKKNHLLESVDLLIEEYIYYDDSKLICLKFDH